MLLIPNLIKLNNQKILRAASSLNTYGKLAISPDNLIYLDIDDAYIHNLFPLLKEENIKKPDYFNKGLAGAHVSVVYPQEPSHFDKKDFGKEFHFKINELIIAEIHVKKYFMLLLEAPMLRQLRVKYGLPEKLHFKNYVIDFHITIGVSKDIIPF